MNKFFFFRSFVSNGESNPKSPPSTDKQIDLEKSVDGSLKSKSKKQVLREQNHGSSQCLRRSLSFSSGSAYDSQFGRNLNEQIDSPGHPSLKHSCHHSSRHRSLTPERQRRSKRSEAAAAHIIERAQHDSLLASREYCDPSESSSHSSDASTRVLDLYVDGEHDELKSVPKRSFNPKNFDKEKGSKHLSREHFEKFTLPSHGREQNPKSQSFREFKGSQQHLLSKDQLEKKVRHESPQKIARSVVERLSQSKFSSKISPKGSDPEIPITIEDIYNGKVSRCSSVFSDGHSQKSSMDESIETVNECYTRNYGIMNHIEALEDVNDGIPQKLKEAEERVIFFSEQLEHETFFLVRDMSVPSLIQTIRNLAKDRLNLAIEVPALFREWNADRKAVTEELRRTRAELDAQTRRLEKENHELQSTLEMELDRRSSDWILKLDKYQAEDHRLRERVRELAEQNVTLQREVSSFTERDADDKIRITSLEQQLEDLGTRVDELRVENKDLHQDLYNFQEKYRAEKEARESIQLNNEDKMKECMDLHRSVTRLQRTCSEQEKSIDGLRGLCEELGKNMSAEDFDSQLGRLRTDNMRLTGLEQSLRKEVETYRLELDSLRHENINLFQRLKGRSKGGCSSFKLECELWNRVNILQNQGLSLLVNSAELCGKLLNQVKRNSCRNVKDVSYNENSGLQNLVIESEVKLQGCKRGIENLSRCLQSVRNMLEENSTQSQLCEADNDIGQENSQKLETNIQAELRAETLLTNLLKEKLYCKELETEQLQAELAAVVRGNDILKCETQNVVDSLSCATHKMKDLELQMIKKDENINQLQNDLQDCNKDLAMVRGLLPYVTEERDQLWKEVKQYSENNMLLNSEINVMKKKVEALDEDILFKEGQITILKDSMGKPFNLFGGPDCMEEFLL
ncbi:hypothetical protein Leryth_008273 [Lithospermum erythrorhizon]|nr:hypothetical protein Leryth_008273 [Lithospermum erythrorhizon]